jgi:CheY-like chemotaxis protein
MKTRILFLDDDPNRRQQFLSESRLTEHDIHFARNYREAVRLLASHRFDVAFLDHDLADFTADGERLAARDDNELTGTDVAKWIAGAMEPASWPGIVVVHSWNPVGARRMADILIDAGLRVRIAPFRVGLMEAAE